MQTRTSQSEISQEQSLDEIIGSSPEQEKGFMAQWYRLTAPPAVPVSANYIQKEKVRRGRLLSIIALALICVQALLTFAGLRESVYLALSDSFSLFVYCGALFFNRSGKVVVAGILLTATLDLTIISSFLLLGQLNAFQLPVFDLFVGVELLAASLLPARSVFVTALFNSIFIASYIKFQQHDVAFEVALRSGFYYNAIMIPILLQITVAVVTYLWVRSYTQAIKRADRAEVIAKLEHMVARQKEEVEEQKQQLEIGIQQLIVAQTQAINGTIEQRIPLPEAKELWPLAGSLNNLFARLRRSYQAENELQRTNKATEYLAHALYNAELAHEPLHMQRTGTMLDPLVLTLNGKSVSSTQFPIEREAQQRTPRRTSM
jgi:uncharacterized coiled-coil protein SlyX